MELYGLSREEIKARGILIGDYYKMEVGEPLEVSVMRKVNRNDVLSYSLSPHKQEDKFMIKYCPNNVVLFDKDFVESGNLSNYVSCHIEKEHSTVIVGNPDKYELKSGILATTGTLSLNGLVQKNRSIYFSSQLSSEMVKKRVHLVSVGLLGNSLFGLFHISRERGLAISIDDSETQAMSVVSMKTRDCLSWDELDIEDWFDKCQVRSVQAQ